MFIFDDDLSSYLSLIPPNGKRGSDFTKSFTKIAPACREERGEEGQQREKRAERKERREEGGERKEGSREKEGVER